VNHSDIVAAIVRRTGLPKKDVESVLGALAKVITGALRDRVPVALFRAIKLSTHDKSVTPRVKGVAQAPVSRRILQIRPTRSFRALINSWDVEVRDG
jgi:hypothetical protein